MKVASATRSDVDIAVMHEHAKALLARPSVKAAIAMTIRTQGKLRLEWLMNVCLLLADSGHPISGRDGPKPVNIDE